MTKRNRKCKKYSRKKTYHKGGTDQKKFTELKENYSTFRENLKNLNNLQTKKRKGNNKNVIVNNFICNTDKELNTKYEVVQTPDDGNSFYHALALGLNQLNESSDKPSNHDAIGVRIHLYKYFYFYKLDIDEKFTNLKTSKDFDDEFKNVITKFIDDTDLVNADELLGTLGKPVNYNVISFASFIFNIQIVVFFNFFKLEEKIFNIYQSTIINLNQCSSNGNNHFEFLKPKENVLEQQGIEDYFCKEAFENNGFVVFSTNNSNNSFYHALAKAIIIENYKLNNNPKDFLLSLMHDKGGFLKNGFINMSKNFKNNPSNADEIVTEILKTKNNDEIENLFQQLPTDESIFLSAKFLNKTIKIINSDNSLKEKFFNVDEYKKNQNINKLIIVGKCRTNNQYVLLKKSDNKILEDSEIKESGPIKIANVDSDLDAFGKMEIKEKDVEEQIKEDSKKQKEENLKKEIELLELGGFSDSLIPIVKNDEFLKKRICSNFI
jgi:hypothetical protein